MRRKASGCVRADIQDHIAALADALNQLPNQHGCGLIIRVIGHIAPVVVHGRAEFPWNALSADIADALRRQKLLGTDKIPAVIRWVFRDETSKALAAGLEPVVHNHIWLVAAHHLHQFCRLPCLAAQVAVGKIEPQDVNLSVVCDQLLDLPVHVRKITVKIDLLVLISRILAHWMVGIVVFREIRVVPVDQGVVQAHAQPLGAHRVHEFPHQIASAGRVCALVIRQFRVKQAKAVVMLRCQYDIPHSGLFCPTRPVSWVIGFRSKLPHIALIFLRWHPGSAHIPFAAPWDRVESPMQEHPEPGLLKPLYPLFPFCHRRCSFPARPFNLRRAFLLIIPAAQPKKQVCCTAFPFFQALLFSLA